MQITNWKTCPGPGDMLPPDNSVREAALAEMRAEALGVISDSIATERMKSAAWVSDAQGDFTNAEYDAITAALIAGDAMEVGRLTLEATRASIRRGAEKEAPQRLAKLVREDEADYAAARMEH